MFPKNSIKAKCDSTKLEVTLRQTKSKLREVKLSSERKGTLAADKETFEKFARLTHTEALELIDRTEDEGKKLMFRTVYKNPQPLDDQLAECVDIDLLRDDGKFVQVSLQQP